MLVKTQQKEEEEEEFSQFFDESRSVARTVMPGQPKGSLSGKGSFSGANMASQVHGSVSRMGGMRARNDDTKSQINKASAVPAKPSGLRGLLNFGAKPKA